MYKAGDCFVIEIEKVIEDGAGYVTNANIIVNDEFLDKLDKLDSDYINEYYGHLQDEAYNKGLEDAWKLAQKFTKYAHGGMSFSEIKKVFGITSFEAIMRLSYQEALAKLEAYEKEQAEIKVGDVVTDKNHTTEILVTEIDDDENTFGGIKATPTDELGNLGGVYSIKPIGNYKKTGKHIDLADLFKQIGGGE